MMISSSRSMQQPTGCVAVTVCSRTQVTPHCSGYTAFAYEQLFLLAFVVFASM